MGNYRKALVAPLVVLVLYVINGLSSGDWTPTVEVKTALAVVIGAVLVYAIPNDDEPLVRRIVVRRKR